MAIQDDFTIYPFSKTIRHTSGTTVYSVTAFYSWLMETFDEPGYMSYEAPMKFNTPTSFSMLNAWHLDNGDGSNLLQFLTGASIDTIHNVTAADPVYMLDMDDDASVWAAIVASDLDLPVADDGTDVGPLLSFKMNYPITDTARIWVRDTRATPAAIADNSAITITGGTGVGDANGASVNGNEVYTNVFTLQDFPGSPNPQPYIYQQHPVAGQGRIRVAEWSGLTNWNRGTAGFDILLPTTLGGSEIDGSNIKTLVRQTGDSYTFVESDLTGGARTPLATETLADTANIDEGEYFLLYDASDTGSFTVGDIIQNTSDAPSTTPADWYAEVVAVQEFTDTATGCLVIRSLDGTISDNDPIYVGTTQEATANGTPGGTFFTWDAATTDFVASDIGKPFTGSISGANRILRGFQIFTATTDGAAVLSADAGFATIDGVNFNTASIHDELYAELSDNDVWAATSGGTGTGAGITADTLYSAPFQLATIISDFSDVTIAHINGTCVTGAPTGTFEVGERVTWSGGGPAIYIADNGTNQVTLGNVEDETGLNVDATVITGQASGATITISGTGGMTDAQTSTFAFTQQSAYTYSVVIEGGAVYKAARSLKDIYKWCQFYVRAGQNSTERTIYVSDGSAITATAAEEYIKADAGYTATKPAPYGTLAGTLLFGAQGVWVQGTAAVDDLRLTDHGGTARQGTPSVLVQVTNTRVSDVVSVFLEDGATGLPDKAQFTSNGITAIGSSTFQLSTSLPVDTPSTGAIFIVDDSFGEADKEHRYRYKSWATDTVTFADEVTGTADGSTANQTLQDTGNFATGVQRGDIIRNTLDPSIGYIVSVDNDNQVTTTQMRDSSGTVVPWNVGDTYTINTLVVASTASDTAFIPYLDAIEDTGTDSVPGVVSNTLLYAADRAVVIRVRNNLAATEIVPFVTTSDILSGGMTVSVIRTEDTVTT